MTKLTKRCSRCKKKKPLKDFYKRAGKNSGYGDNLGSHCKKCVADTARESVKKNPIKHRRIQKKSHLKRCYGLSIEDWDKMFAGQRGRCAICGVHQSKLKKPLCVDHNHETGQVRELLCSGCNPAIGALGADYGTDLLQKAIEYVEKYQ